jgi:integrase
MTAITETTRTKRFTCPPNVVATPGGSPHRTSIGEDYPTVRVGLTNRILLLRTEPCSFRKNSRKSGVHVKYVQELLGHADISLTLNVYSHVLPDMGDAAAGAMDDALG